MNVKDFITQEFLMFQKSHTVKDADAKATFHFIFGLIVMAALLKQLSKADANYLIAELNALYNTLESRI